MSDNIERIKNLCTENARTRNLQYSCLDEIAKNLRNGCSK